MRARRIITTCFAAIMLMMAMPTDVLAVINSTTDAQGGKQARRDRLTDISQKEDQRSVAVFEDTMNTLRTCLTRTQRLLPSHGPAPGKTQARSMESRKHDLLYNPQNFSWRQETTPFPSFVSRTYYVIALRHILC
ncbi:MAG: hypothetical protein PUD14_09500 [Prevotellaceae bacterium]|nr:hypothetical protein [Prevotellaceae bacterium]